MALAAEHPVELEPTLLPLPRARFGPHRGIEQLHFKVGTPVFPDKQSLVMDCIDRIDWIRAWTRARRSQVVVAFYTVMAATICHPPTSCSGARSLLPILRRPSVRRLTK